jgi:hypothetical protein
MPFFEMFQKSPSVASPYGGILTGSNKNKWPADIFFGGL